MATRYVTKHGSASDSNGGTNATTDAWATAYKGFSSISGGDTLKFGTGTYDIDRSSIYTPIPNGTSGNPTTITDNADGQVVFNHPGSGYSGLLYFSDRPSAPTYISFIGTSRNQLKFDMENQEKGNIVYLGGSNEGSNIRFENVEMTRCLHPSFIGGSTPNITFKNCDIHGNRGSVDRCHAIYASGSNLVVDGCKLYDSNGWGIHCYPHTGTGRQFINNFIWDNNGTPSNGSAGDGILMSNGSGIISNNVIYANGQSGIALWRTANVNILHNTIHGNGLVSGTWYGIELGGQSGTNTGTLIANNTIIGNDTAAIRVHSNATGTIIDFNRCDSAVSDAGSSTITNHVSTAVATTEWVDPTNATLASRDYSIKAGAGAIYNASTNNVTARGVATDIEGTTRVYPDQGAYAYGTTTPPDPPTIGHNSTYVVTTVYGDVVVTLVKGTNNIVECTLQGTGASALCVDNTDVTVTRVT